MVKHIILWQLKDEFNNKEVKQNIKDNLEALKKGIVNLRKHIDNMRSYGVSVVVAVNSFITDTDAV